MQRLGCVCLVKGKGHAATKLNQRYSYSRVASSILKEQGQGYKYKERDELEMKGHGSKFEEWQRTSMPSIDNTFISFQIEFLFNVSYDHSHSHDEESELVWMSGEVIEIVNAKKNKVKIRWHEKWLTEGEDSESTQVLLKSLWNHKQAKAGAWRQHF